MHLHKTNKIRLKQTNDLISQMVKYLFFTFITFIAYTQISAQGCVAIRTVGGLNTMQHAGMLHDGLLHEGMTELKDTSKWDLNVTDRYFKSYKHFSGTTENTQRVDDGTDVRNFSRSMDIALVRKINEQWSVGIDLPYVYNERSSLYEHISNVKGSPRFSTYAQGIGDIRLTAYKWIIAPKDGRKGNLLGGIGIKLPTGNYKATDQFHYSLTATREGPVDQSIQPGDGGWGLTLELNGFRSINTTWSLYSNVYYLINPMGNNGVSTLRGVAIANPPTASQAAAIKYTSDVMSVPDQYLLRAGTNWTRNALTISLGARYECVPTSDLIGDNTGFRRPGSVLAIEPGANYSYKKLNFYLYAPVAIRRERPQSYPDILKTNDTNVFTRGDAAFADYSISIGVGYKF